MKKLTIYVFDGPPENDMMRTPGLPSVQVEGLNSFTDRELAAVFMGTSGYLTAARPGSSQYIAEILQHMNLIAPESVKAHVEAMTAPPPLAEDWSWLDEVPVPPVSDDAGEE